MDRGLKFKAFISYSHEDEKWAKWLHRSLERYRIPKHIVESRGLTSDRLVPIFRDREELGSASGLSEKIGEALDASEYLVVLCSRSSTESKWVNAEIERYLDSGGADRVLCLIVDDEPPACIPKVLRSHEPLAADARKAGDGQANARLKLIAGLIDVGLDDLRQRESQRRHRRMAIITVSTLVALVFTAFLAINAILARDEANQRRQQAEDLLGFMVGDLREQLEPIGRLDVLEEVGNQAMAYFATVRVKDLTDIELRRQAQVMTQLGEIRVSELQYQEALASFSEAYERNAALYRNEPGDGERLFERGQAEFWVAFVHWRSGNLDEAREWLTRYRDSSIKMVQLESGRDDWVQEVAFGYHNLAVLDQETGNLDAASTGFTRELETLYELQARDESLARRYDIADAISWLGNIALKQGELWAAREYYEQSAEQIHYLTLAEPDNRQWQYYWAHGEQRVVEVASITGELERAADLADVVIAAFDSLAVHDPDNLDWQRASTKPRILKGAILAAGGDMTSAADLAQQSIMRLERLVETNAIDINVLEHLADAYALASWTELAAGNHTAALEANRLALEYLRSIESAGRLNDERSGKLASAHIVRGELQHAMGEAVLAEDSWKHAVELLEQGAGGTESHFLLDPWARVLIHIGRQEEAQKVRSALEARRYVPLKAWPN